jgi:hypothetical protein
MRSELHRMPDHPAMRHVAALALVALAVAAAPADTYVRLNVAQILAATPQIEREHPPQNLPFAYYRLKGTDVSGFVIPNIVGDGYLSNRQEVLVVPLDSGGSGGVFHVLLWTRVAGAAWHFAGQIASPDGRLGVSIDNGDLVAVIPVYAPNDADCCPSSLRRVRYTLDGTALRQIQARSDCAVTPTDVVRKYYQLLSWQRYREMYALLSARYRAAHPYGAWGRALAPVRAAIVEASLGRASTDVQIRVYLEDADGSAKSYSGMWHVVRSGTSWLLDSSAISQDSKLSTELLNLPDRTPAEEWLNRQPALQPGVFGNLVSNAYTHLRTSTPRFDCLVDASGATSVETSGYDAGCSSIDGDGLEFRLGPAGPQEYDVLYDHANRLVWFTRGCCSEEEDVLLADVAPPPFCFPDAASLAQMRTQLGIRLGESQAAVERVYGQAHPVTAGAYRLLLYQYTPKTSDNALRGGSCMQSSFAFSKGALVAIDFLNSC